MTLPGAPAVPGISDSIEFLVQFGDSSLQNLAARTQAAVTEVLQAEVKVLPSWQNATAILYDGLERGIPFVLSLLQGIIDKLFNEVSSFPGVSEALAAIEEVPQLGPLVEALTGTVGTLADLATRTLLTGLIPSLNASIITAGTFLTSLIPGLDASKIISGVFSTGLIPNITAAMSTDVQSIVDGVYQAIHGGASTGNLVSTVKTSLLNIPGANVVSAVLASIVPSLDASKIVTGVFGTGLIPNITKAMSTDMQSIVDMIYQAIFGGSSTGNAITTIKTGLLAIPGANIASSILASIVPALDASKITTGIFSTGLIPNITAAMSTDVQAIADGVYQAVHGGSSTGNAISTIKTSLLNIPGANVISAVLASIIPSLDASKITTGVFGTGLIPSLAASIITSGTFATGLIPNVTKAMSTDLQGIIDNIFQAVNGGASTGNTLASVKTSLLNIPGANVVSAVLASIIPSLDASKITTGTFATGLIPNLNASIITAGTFATGLIPNITKAMSTDMQTIVDNVYQAINGGSSTGNTLASIKTNLLNIPGVNIVSSVLASIVPALDASKITTGTFANSFLPGVLPLNLFNGTVMAGKNLVINPSFEDSTINRWPVIGASGSVAYSTTFARSGTQSFKVITANTTGGSHSDAFALGPDPNKNMWTGDPGSYIRVQAGQWFYSEIYVRAGAGNTATAGIITIEAFVVDSSGVNAPTFGSLTNQPAPNAISNSGSTKLSGWYQIPAGYDSIAPFAWMQGQNVINQTYYWDDARIVEETVSQSIIQQIFGGTAIAPALNTALTVAGQTVATVQSNAQGVLDAIENASNGVVSGAVNTLVSDTQTNMNNLFNAIPNFLQGVAGFFGIGGVNTSLSASAATTGGLQSGLSGTQAQIAAIFNVSPTTAGTVNQTIDFSTIANQNSMSGIMLPGTSSGNGFMGVTSGEAVLQGPSGSGAATDLEIFPTATTSDYQVIDVTLGSLHDLLAGNCQLIIGGRCNSSRDTLVYITTLATSGVPNVTLWSLVTGTAHSLSGPVNVPSMSTGGKLRLVLGDPGSSSPYAMQVLYNGTPIITYSDVSHVSQVGASFRNVGLWVVDIGTHIPPAVKTVTYQDNPPTSGAYPFSGTPAAGTKGRLYTCSDVGLTQRDNGSSWERIQGGPLGWFTAPPSSGWSAVNAGTSTFAADKDAMLLTATDQASYTLRCRVRTLTPSSNYTATFYLETLALPANYWSSGIILRNSSGGGIVHFQFGVDTTNFDSNSCFMAVEKWTNATTISSNYINRSVRFMAGGIPNWLRIRDDGTNRYCEYSYNGVDWVTLHSVGRTDFITPDQIGIAVVNDGTGQPIPLRIRSLAGVS